MAFWNRRKTEKRAEGMTEIEDSLLKAMLGGGTATKKMAMAVPTVAGAVDMIGGIIASTPVKLYREQNGRTEEAKDDIRAKLLNDETGDTLTPNEFWRAMVRDYYLGKGGFAYIEKAFGMVRSLRYVDEEHVSIKRNEDPIFKAYSIMVNGEEYFPFCFLRILRNTRDGMTGRPITEENGEIIETAYETILFEKALLKRGGAKKGFLKAERKLDQGQLNSLREGFRRLYSNGSENTVVLNNGLDFKEASATSMEMQLKENKRANAEDLAKLFHIQPDVLAGTGEENAISAVAKLAAIPLMRTIESALNRDFLRETEKKDHYWAFDTKQLLKGSMKERFEAYKLAVDGNFMQIDEVRYEEDMKPLGLNWIRLGLQDVLYDPKTGTVYTPNTNQTGGLRDPGGKGGEEENGN